MIKICPCLVKRALPDRVALGMMHGETIACAHMNPEPIILASESPRRAALLESIGIPYLKIVPSIDETVFDHLEPADRVVCLARTKAGRGVELYKAEQHSHAAHMPLSDRPRLVLGADTLVAFHSAETWETIGKPRDISDAIAMLRKEAGQRQHVFSGLCLFDMESGTSYCALSVSEVLFAPMSDEEIRWYCESGEWRGAAGAYRIQGLGSCFIKEIKGSPSGVMGLPIHELYGILRDAGYRGIPRMQENPSKAGVRQDMLDIFRLSER